MIKLAIYHTSERASGELVGILERGQYFNDHKRFFVIIIDIRIPNSLFFYAPSLAHDLNIAVAGGPAS